MGLSGWSYADCLPYFRKAQTHELGADEYRGGDGPLHVSAGKMGNPLFKAWLEAGRSEEQPSELQSLMRISYAVLCLQKKDDTVIRKQAARLSTCMTSQS